MVFTDTDRHALCFMYSGSFIKRVDFYNLVSSFSDLSLSVVIKAATEHKNLVIVGNRRVALPRLNQILGIFQLNSLPSNSA